MTELNSLELGVLTKVLSGDNVCLTGLRNQVALLRVASREMTGVGFYTTFAIPSETPRAAVPLGSLRFGDVVASLPGLRNGAGFLVYVENGKLHMLEGFSYDEPWPKQNVEMFELRYVDSNRESVLRQLHCP